MSFIFDEIIPGMDALKYKNYIYYFAFDKGFPEITFKTKYNLEAIDNSSLMKLKSRKYVYGIDIYGNILLKTTEDKFEQKLKEKGLIWNSERYYQTKEAPFDTAKYDRIRFDFEWDNIDYYAVLSNGKFAVIDEFQNILIDYDFLPIYIWEIKGKPHFIVRNPQTNLKGIIDIDKNVIIPPKYGYLSSFSFNEKIYFAAKSAQTGLCGVIDINENIVIPFMYDAIHDWNIEYDRKTIQVQKDDKCGLIDINKNILLDFKYQYIYGFIYGEYSFAKAENDKWGVINRKGEETEFDIKDIQELKLKFSSKKAKLCRKEHYGY